VVTALSTGEGALGSASFSRLSDTWSRAQWLGWLFVPVLLALGTLLVVAWLGQWHLSRDDYWVIQRDWFVTANQALDGLLPAGFWSQLTLLGDGAVLLCLGSPLLLWRPQAWAAMLGAAPLAALFSESAKHLFSVPRPAAVLDVQTFTVIGHALTAHNSLPSGHTLTLFAGVIAVLAILTPRPHGWGQYGLVLALMVLATLLCASRMAVGAHWPLDLVAGAAGGWLAGLSGAALTRRYRGWWQFTKRSIGRYVLATLLLILSIWLLEQAIAVGPDALMLWLAALAGLAVAGAALASLPAALGHARGTGSSGS